MTTIFTLPQQVPVNSSGTPYPGAKLYFYAAGTTTAQNVYTDIDLTDAHSQPVVADANGRFEPIYLDPNAAADYRVQLYTLGSVLIYDEDNVPRSNSFNTADVFTAILTVDGPGTGLDADLLDGYDSAEFAVLAENETVTGDWTIAGSFTYSAPVAGTAFRPSQATVASETNVTYNANYSVWYISGTTTINTITDPGTGSPIITLLFSTSVTVNDATTSTGNIRLAGAANLSATANDVLTLIWSETDSEWREVSRSVN